MKRPSFQFYPSDWQANSNLRRCSHEEKGIWIDVLCLLHDQEEYGVARWPLSDIAQSIGSSVPKLRGLITKGVFKGADSGKVCESLIYTPRSGRKNGPSVVLIEQQPGPVWFSSRMVEDEYKRVLRGESGATPKATPDDSPKGGIGAAPKGVSDSPKATPDHSPSHAGGSRAAPSSSSSSSSLKAINQSSPSLSQPVPRDATTSVMTFPDVPTEPGHWLEWFNAEEGLCLDPTSRFDRKGFWPIATRWCKAGVTQSQMREAIAKARAEAVEPIANLPAYVDRVIANQNAPPKALTPAAASTLAAARAIFGTEIEANHGYGRIIDVEPVATRALGS